MAATLPTYTVVLTRHPGGWGIEPVGLVKIPGYVQENAGPDGCVRRSRDLAELIPDEARTVVSAVLNVDRYAFHLRFCMPSGECVAHSTIRYGVPPGEREPVTYEVVQTTPGLRRAALVAAS